MSVLVSRDKWAYICCYGNGQNAAVVLFIATDVIVVGVAPINRATWLV